MTATIRRRTVTPAEQDETAASTSSDNQKGGSAETDDGWDWKGIMSWDWKGIMITTLQLFALVAVLPAFLNFAALIREERELRPDGVVIDVRHGQKLFKTCNGTGSPTVILDAPGGETSDAWSLIFPAVAKFTKVCMYDRAGLGYSDRVLKGMNESAKVGKAYTVERMVEDFHKLFETEKKPFVLVGADLGASVVKFYTQLFQDEVAATVLINPIFEGIFLGGSDNPWSKYWYNSFMPSLQLHHILSALGITRVGIQTGLIREPMGFPKTPDIVKNRQKYLRCKPGHISSIVEESHFLNETLSQSRTMQKLRPYPDHIPTSLIWTDRYSVKVPKDKNQVWLKSQEMFTKSFSKYPYPTTKLSGFLPETLFSKHKNIVKVIRTSVEEWNKKSKGSSKY